MSKSEDKIRCPECNSTQIHVDKKGYDAGGGCCGTIIFGPLGLLCGQFGANKIRITCISCGHSWKRWITFHVMEFLKDVSK